MSFPSNVQYFNTKCTNWLDSTWSLEREGDTSAASFLLKSTLPDGGDGGRGRGGRVKSGDGENQLQRCVKSRGGGGLTLGLANPCNKRTSFCPIQYLMYSNNSTVPTVFLKI
jgi:hypothetical protein